MTRDVNIGVRRAPLTSDELKRHLLALVLAAVLVWYTSLAVPTHTNTRRSRASEEDGHGGAVREGCAVSERGEIEALDAGTAVPDEELD